ncbi:hypothetical protein [Lacinutrix chionoecetis]
MKKAISIITILLLFGCKKQPEKVTPHIEPPVKTKVEYTWSTNSYDFSSVPHDTLFVTGKHIIFTKPSVEEFKLLEDEKGINEVDSDFGFYTSKVIDSLKSTHKITTTSKRIIGIVEVNDTTYIDRLKPKARISKDPIHYSAIIVFNDFFTIYPNVYTDDAYYTIITDYYNNVRYEKPIEYKYVISRNGLNIRQANGTVDGKFNNGDFVKILGYTDDVIEIEDEGKTIKGRWAIIQWEDVVGMSNTTRKRYVFEGFLGNIEDVKVFEDQICVGSKLTSETRHNTKEANIECLSAYLDLELISKARFDAIKSINNKQLAANALVKIEKNKDSTHNITLPVKDSVVVYKSKVGYSNSTHEYYGDVDFLNQYVMYHVYPEAEDAFYSFIDRTSGKETAIFPEFPHVTPDKKRIISFVYNVYDEQFFIEIYNINSDNSITLSHAFNFIHWLKTYQNEIKWIVNDEFAIEIVNKNIWNGSDVKSPQYLKIKMK